MQSKLTRRAVLAGASAIAAVAALPAIPALSGVEQDPIAELGRRWLAAKKRWSHWGHIEDELAFEFGTGSPEHREPYRLHKQADDEMRALEGMIIAGQATTVAGLLARWEIIEWLGDYCDSSNPSDHDPKAIAMRADLERLAGEARL